MTASATGLPGPTMASTPSRQGAATQSCQMEALGTQGANARRDNAVEPGRGDHGYVPMARLRWLMGAVAVLVAVGAAAGIGVDATRGAQTTADEPQYLLTALSIWEDFSLDISDELAAERYREFHGADLPVQTRVLGDGRQVSPHDPLLGFLLAVPVGLGGWVGAKAALAALAGALAALVVWVAHRRFGVSVWVAATVVSVFFLSPPLAVYATQIYPEMVAALAVTAGVAALTGRPRTGSVFVLTAAVVALPWLAVKYVPVALVLAVAGVLWLPPRWRFRWALVLAATGVAYVGVHQWLYEGLTAYAAGDHFVGGEFTAVGTQTDLWGRSTRLIGLLIDQGFGLGAWQPAYLAMAITAGWWITRVRREGPLLVVVATAGWLVATFVALTMHGWWFPGRQVVVILPMLIVLMSIWADTSRNRIVGLVIAGAVGVGAYVALVVEGLAGRLTWVVDFASTSYLPYRLLARFLPDYMDPGVRTWLLHGMWVVLLGVGVVTGWISGRPAKGAGVLPAEQMFKANDRTER